MIDPPSLESMAPRGKVWYALGLILGGTLAYIIRRFSWRGTWSKTAAEQSKSVERLSVGPLGPARLGRWF